MKILSIESSCDETAAAITEDGRKVLSSVIATQIDEHKLYGGVVPEIASRRHCENITGVCAEALEKADMTLDDVDAVAVTNAPRTYRRSACRCELRQGTCTCKEQAAYCGAPHKRSYCGKLHNPPRARAALSVPCGIGRSQPYCKGKQLHRA